MGKGEHGNTAKILVTGLRALLKASHHGSFENFEFFERPWPVRT